MGLLAPHPVSLLLERSWKLPSVQELSEHQSPGRSLHCILQPSGWFGDGHVTQVGPITMEPGLVQEQLRTKLFLSPWT